MCVRQEYWLTRKYSPRGAFVLDTKCCVHNHPGDRVPTGSILERLVEGKLPIDTLRGSVIFYFYEVYDIWVEPAAFRVG